MPTKTNTDARSSQKSILTSSKVGSVVMGCRRLWHFFWVVGGCMALGLVPATAAEKTAIELAVFRDASAEMPLEQVLALEPEAFVPYGPDFPSLGYTKDAIWLRARLAAGSGIGANFVAELGIARLSEVGWHVFAEGSDGLRPLARTELGMRHPGVAFEVPKQTVVWIYVKVKSDTTIHLPLRVMPLTDYPVFIKRRDLAEFAVIALGVAVMFGTFVLGAFTRSRQFFLLCLHMLTYLLYQFAFDGYLSWLWPSVPRWMERNMLLVLTFVGPGIHLLLVSLYQKESGGTRRLSTVLWWAGQISIGLGLISAVLPFPTAVWVNARGHLPFFCIGFIGSLIHALRCRTVSSFLMTLGWFMALAPGVLIHLRLYGLSQHPWLLEIIVLLRWFSPTVFLLSLGSVAVQISRNQSERERRLRAEQATTLAQLQALRYQINPHFLYNTLNLIDALGHEAPARLSLLVRKLAAFLRMRLVPSANQLTSLREEMESVHAYLAIEKVRFGEQLQVIETIDPAALSCEVPDLLLQSLVENAVKHSHSEDGICRVKVDVRLKADRLILTVENHGSLSRSGAHAMPNTGIGQSNLKERLNLHYQGQGSFSIVEQQGQVLATVDIPAKPKP